MPPEKLEEILKTLAFSNAKEDRPIVLQLYKNEYARRIAQAEAINFRHLNWGDEEIIQVANSLQHTKKLESLNLSRNHFGVAGCQALGNVILESKCYDHLMALTLTGNEGIGNEGVAVMADALVRIRCVDLDSIGLGVSGCRT